MSPNKQLMRRSQDEVQEKVHSERNVSFHFKFPGSDCLDLCSAGVSVAD